MRKILLVDDDVAVTNYLMVFLMQTDKYESTVVNDSTEVPDILDRESFDIVLLDMDMPRLSGLDILKIIREKGLNLPVIILTGVSDVDLAVKSMKLGAFDYMTKPVEDDQLLEVLDRAIDNHTVQSKISTMPKSLRKEDLKNAHVFEHFPTQDENMIRMLYAAEKLAAGEQSIFIWGERGTGKEALAKAIHNLSPRRKGPFVSINAAAQDPTSFNSEFFGQAKDWRGSREEMSGFLESAAGGTVFIDEIEFLTKPAQERLRRVIQTNEYYREHSTTIRKVDVRFIVSAQVDLTAPEHKESFSRDLLYHLMINSLRIPPLRERKGDIKLLAEHCFLQEIEKHDKVGMSISPDFIELLENYNFPDNLQELSGLVASAVINEDSDTISIESLTPYMRDVIKSGGELIRFQPRPLREVQKELILNTIKYFRNDRKAAANALEISTDEMATILSQGRISSRRMKTERPNL